MSLRFKKKGPMVYTARLRCSRTGPGGRPFRTDDAVRAIKEKGHWYTDKTVAVAGAFMPWESVIVENKKRWKTLREAKAALNQYARDCGAIND